MSWLVLITAMLSADPASEMQGGRDDRQLKRYEFHSVRMGVPWELQFYAQNEADANRAAKAAWQRVREIDKIMSDYDPDSELSRLCLTAGSGKVVNVSPELLFVLSRSNQLSCQTNGSFDVTVGKLVDLWRIARRRKKIPEETKLESALRTVGYKKMVIDCRNSTVKLSQSGMRLDLGAIAKGYAADEALKVLKQHGITSALIDAGGDLVAGDAPPGKEGWVIGVEPLLQKDAKPKTFINLKNAAVATSGDAYKYLEIDGVRYSHIVNPKTGLGLTDRSSVTVIAKDGITSDSLASAISVMGSGKGFKILKCYPRSAAYVVKVDNVNTRIDKSNAFSKYMVQSLNDTDGEKSEP